MITHKTLELSVLSWQIYQTCRVNIHKYSHTHTKLHCTSTQTSCNPSHLCTQDSTQHTHTHCDSMEHTCTCTDISTPEFTQNIHPLTKHGTQPHTCTRIHCTSCAVLLVEIATLAHKVGNDAMERTSLIPKPSLVRAQLPEILGSFWYHIRTQFLQCTSVDMSDCDG